MGEEAKQGEGGEGKGGGFGDLDKVDVIDGKRSEDVMTERAAVEVWYKFDSIDVIEPEVDFLPDSRRLLY